MKLQIKYNEFEEDLFQSCIRREELGSTAYGQLIALPHPDHLISQKTIVITAILDKPIVWSKQKAQLIFLICVEKGNQNKSRLHKFSNPWTDITVFDELNAALNNAESVKYQVADLNASSLMRVASARHKATDTLPTVIWQKSNTLTIQMY